MEGDAKRMHIEFFLVLRFLTGFRQIFDRILCFSNICKADYNITGVCEYSITGRIYSATEFTILKFYEVQPFPKICPAVTGCPDYDNSDEN